LICIGFNAIEKWSTVVSKSATRPHAKMPTWVKMWMGNRLPDLQPFVDSPGVTSQTTDAKSRGARHAVDVQSTERQQANLFWRATHISLTPFLHPPSTPAGGSRVVVPGLLRAERRGALWRRRRRWIARAQLGSEHCVWRDQSRSDLVTQRLLQGLEFLPILQRLLRHSFVQML